MMRLTGTAVLAAAVLLATGGHALADPTATPTETRPIPDALITTEPPPDWQEPGADEEEPELGPPGKRKGTFKITYYWMAAEGRGKRKVQLYDKRCRKVAKVSRDFSRRLRLEGGGKLRNGKVLTYSGRCRCPSSPCYRFARRGHKWGTGVRERPLSPFRSVAVDPRHVSIGTVLYIPELDGMAMPGSAPYGGFVHDGCVVADDQGGGIRGREIDLFAAKKQHYRSIQRRHRMKKVTVFEGGERCKSFNRRPSGKPGSS